MTSDLDPTPPIDLDHLAAQTFGSVELERDVLRLFLTQSRDCVARLQREPDARVAHLLLGSARGIGARAVERAAAVLENVLLAGTGSGKAEIDGLADAVEAANRFIEARLGSG